MNNHLERTYIDQIANWAWRDKPSYQPGTVPTMVSLQELQMLEWLGRTFPFQPGEMIVDGGAFLGGSTHAVATGLKLNQNALALSCRIHSYDHFIASEKPAVRNLIGDIEAGSSFYSMYLDNISDVKDVVEIHAGDFTHAIAPASIGVLFVDVAKTSQLNDVVLDRFFPSMIPGRTIVIQQDHNDQHCVWINLAMEYFADHFEYLCDDGGSRIFLFTKAFENIGLSKQLQEVPLDRKIELCHQAVAKAKSPVAGYLSRVSTAWLIADRDRHEALAYLQSIAAEQPWPSEEPYINYAIRGMGLGV
jgi:hypothetical protein